MSRRQMLACVPRLNPAIRLKDLDTGRVVVVYAKAANPLVRVLRRWFAIPEVAELLLDDIGTKVIRQIDGATTVADLIAYVAAECKLSRKESEVALLKYLDTLGRRNLIGFEVRSGIER